MGLQIESQIFKWLQNLKIVKQAKRNSQGKIELSQPVTAKFFDGVYISQIVRDILKHRGDEELAKKLASIRQNSTPAIRLYNWNLLGQALKKIGHIIDYTQKSKLLNLEPEAITKIIKYLWSIRIEEPNQPGNLTVSLKDAGNRSLKEAKNVFEMLVISICNNFKLSVQHALNLFLDNNKYLAHLLVKGVKGSYDPVLLMLSDVHQHIDFIVDSLLVVDEKESLDLFLGALKPCLISKEVTVAESCLALLKDFIQVYMQKGLKMEVVCNWMQRQGFDTTFFSIKRHPSLFSQSMTVAYSYMDNNLFKKLQPQDKSLLWDNEADRLMFYRQLIDESHRQLLEHFVADPVFNQWNRVCVKAMKKANTSHQLYELLSLLEKLWSSYPESFEKSQLNLPGVFTVFLKNCILSQYEIVFTEAARIIFTLIVQLGLAKNQQAPILFKAAISALGQIENEQHMEFMLHGFVQIMKDIPSLPAAPLVDPLLKLIAGGSSATMLEIVRMVLGQGRIKQYQQEDLEEALLKIIFSDVQHSEMAQELLIEHLKQQINSESLQQYCVAALAQFYSYAKQAHKPLKQLKLDFYRYNQQQFLRKIEPAFLRNITKYLHMSNIVSFLQKAIFISNSCKEEVQPHVFHTYIRVERELKRQHVSRLLMPILRSYYDQEELPVRLEHYLEDIIPPAISFQSINNSVETTPIVSKKVSRLKTEENKRTSRVISISKDLQMIKRRREEEKEKMLLLEKQKEAEEEKKHLHLSMINQQRIVEYGKSRELDLDYKYLLDFDSFKTQNRSLGLPQINLLHLKQDEEQQYIEDATAVMKKYRKLWRFLFFKYSSYGIKGAAENQQPEEKISGADILKFLKDYSMEQMISKQKVLLLVRRVNELQKRKTDPGNLPYLGFEQYIIQFCYQAYRKQYPQNSPGRQVMQFINDIKKITAARGGSVDMFDSPQEMYFQQTDVIRQFNRRLSDNPDYPLPQGYKKVKQTEFKYSYTVTQFQKGIKKSTTDVMEVLDEILFNSLGFRLLEPLTHCEQKNLARPVLFQKMKQKIKDYHGGYLIPKKSAYLPRIEKEPSPNKLEFHLHVPFSLGIKLGIAGTDPKLKILAEEVAYWLDDALDAVEAGKDKVGNKSKTRVQNDLIRRKRSEALQFRIEKQEQEKKERIRAQTLKVQTVKYHQNKKEQDKKTRQQMKLQRLKRREREQTMMDKRKQQYQQALSKLEAKRKQIQEKKEVELKLKKKQHEKYKKNVDEYFKKKRSQIQQQERSMKSSKQQTIKLERLQKKKQEQLKKKLEIEVFKKQQTVLEKLATSKEIYEQTWKSEQIQAQMQTYRPGLKLMFDLLVKYQKSKISNTGAEEIGLSTLNFYALKARLTPLIVSKNTLAILFRSMIKNQKHNGINFSQFQELIFKMAVKGKEILNKYQRDQQQQMGESGMPSLKSSPQLQLSRKKSITDEYTLDATGVIPQTVRRLMQFLDLPDDKPEAEERFRGLLQRKSSKPTNTILKQAREMLESTIM